jgi:replicative DNA helicase Mcm
MALQGSNTISISFQDFYAFNPEAAHEVIEKPDDFLQRWLEPAAFSQLRHEDQEYADKLAAKNEKLKVRLTDLFSTVPLRQIGAENLNKMVMVEAIVVRVTPAKALVETAAFECKRCGETQMIKQAQGLFIKGPKKCVDKDCPAKGQYLFTFVQDKSIFVDSQEIRIQELPDELPPGQLPRSINVLLVGKDLVNIARPGDHVKIVSIVRAFTSTTPGSGKLRAFVFQLEANSIDVMSKDPEFIPSVEEEQQILELSRDPFVHRKILASIAPSICGLEHVKEAVTYLLFGGVKKTLPDMNIRGEINCLLVGDPGTAKSQVLKYVSQVAPRGLYTSGRGTTAAGLTAAVVREKSGSMTLEGGILVLADKGVACIDEFDKMRPEDRVAIHEAMEQHTVSVAKGGIVATLNARTAMLAAANPTLGRYEPHRTVAENIGNFQVTLLSRFDLIFVIRDIPDEEADGKLSGHILNLHKDKAPPREPPVNPDLLRKYIAYSRQYQPKFTQEALERIQRFYMEMRKASESEGSPIAITSRQLESLVRIAEARARVALQTEVTAADAEAAVKLMKQSLMEVGIDVANYQVDIDIIMTGKPKSLRDKASAVINTLIELQRETGFVEKDVLLTELQVKHKLERQECWRILDSLMRDGSVFEPKEGCLKKT